MYWRKRVVDHLRREHLFLGERLPAPRVRVQRAVLEGLARHLGQRRLADRVLGHVALDLHREELRRQHQAGLAVPGADAPLLGQRVERARRVLVEADDQRDSALPGRQHRVRRDQRRAAGRAPVLDVDEGHAGEAEHGHGRVGVARGVGAAGGEVDLVPAQAGVGERGAGGVCGHLQAGDAGVAAERVDAEADDGDVVAHDSGLKAKGASGISVSSISIPISSFAGSDSVSRASTRTSPGSSM